MLDAELGADDDDFEDRLRQLLEPRMDELQEKHSDDLHIQVLEAAERALMKLVLRRVEGNQVQAAKVLGIHRNTLHRRLKALDLDPDRYRLP